MSAFFVSNMKWRLLLDLFSRSSFIVVTVLIGRVLGVGEFGKFGYAISLAQIFYILTDPGLHLQLVKELGKQAERKEKTWKVFFDLKLAFMGLTLMVVLLLSSLVWKWGSPWILTMAVFWMLGNSFLDFDQAVCNGVGRLDLARTQMLIQRGLLLVAAGAALLFFPTLGGIMIAVAGGNVAGTLVSHVYVFRKMNLPLSFGFDGKEWKRIVWQSLPNAIGGTFAAWRLRIGILILGWLGTSQEVGEYTAAFRIFETTYIIPTAVMAVGIPYLASALQKGRPIFDSEVRQLCAKMIPFSFLWAALLFTFRSFLLNGLFGSRYSGAAPALAVLAAVSGIVILNHLIYYLMVVFNYQRRHALHEGLLFLAGLVLYSHFISAAGAEGAARTLLCTETTLLLLNTLYLFRRQASPPIVPPQATAHDEMTAT